MTLAVLSVLHALALPSFSYLRDRALQLHTVDQLQTAVAACTASFGQQRDNRNPLRLVRASESPSRYKPLTFLAAVKTMRRVSVSGFSRRWAGICTGCGSGSNAPSPIAQEAAW
jgi:type II secretory pathway pseudopilin PulG